MHPKPIHGNFIQHAFITQNVVLLIVLSCIHSGSPFTQLKD